MTSSVKIKSHNFPVLLTTTDLRIEADGTRTYTQSDRVILSTDPELEFYCTTNRGLQVSDLEYDDPLVLERIEADERAAAAKAPAILSS